MLPRSLLVKPVNARCNLACDYCFYRMKSDLFPHAKLMSEEVLEAMISQFMDMCAGSASFSWQGGEPLLAGLDFFRRAVKLQEKYGRGHVVSNAFMTNGTLLDEDWIDFFEEYKFLVGVSLDGPRRLHNHYRKRPDGRPTFGEVMESINLLKDSDVDFNILTVINDVNVDYPEEIYNFLVDNGLHHLQFVPCYELNPETGKQEDFNVDQERFGEFLCRVFDLWKRDFPDIYIRMFNSILSVEVGGEAGLCTFGPICAHYVVIEHNGNVYPCDFFVEEETYLGNIMEEDLSTIVESTELRNFQRNKSRLPAECLDCDWVDLCYGGCQYHRRGWRYPDRSYFCPSYRRFFEYSEEGFEELERSI